MDTKVAERAAPIASDAGASALPACEKSEYVGAVTLVRFSVDGSLLYVGVGPALYIYETATGDLVAQHDILTRGILHGCDFGAFVYVCARHYSDNVVDANACANAKPVRYAYWLNNSAERRGQ